MMSPLSFANDTATFFKLSRGSLSAADYISNIPNIKGKIDDDMLNNGPVIYVSSNNQVTPLLMNAHLTFLGFRAQVEAIGDSNGFSFSADGKISIDGLVLEGPAIVSAVATIKPKQKASGHLTLNMDMRLDLPSIPLSRFGQSITLPSVNQSLVRFNIGVNVVIGWPNTGTGFTLDFNYSVRVLDENFDLSIKLSLSPAELDSLYKVVDRVIKDFRDKFVDIMMNRLGGKEVNQVVDFVKNKFGQTGKDLVIAATILTNEKPESIISKIGLKALNLQDISDVLNVLNGFYRNDPGHVQRLAAELLGIPIPKIPIPNIPIPKIPGLPWSIDALDAPMPESTMKDVPVSNATENIAKVAGDATTTPSLASEGLTSIVLMTTTNGTETEAKVPVIAAVPAKEADAALQWTQEQVDKYVQEQRIGFIKSSLQFFTPDEVFESSKTIFSDLSAMKVREYIAEASVSLEGLKGVETIKSTNGN
jgi:hypothetical protein